MEIVMTNHVEPGESFVGSAIREVFEETGLTVSNLTFCGIVHWDHLDTGDQYIVYLYRTENFSGELLNNSEEGEVFWTDRETFLDLDLADQFADQYQMFWREDVNEMYIPWRTKEHGPYRYEIL